VIRAERGDIWSYSESHFIVIPTNIGWKWQDGRNVMGRGLALQATKKWPYFSFWFGEMCRRHGEKTPTCVYPYGPLIAFPVKPLNKKEPHLSWRSNADTGLIERSARELAAIEVPKPVALPLVGCGNGKLEMSEVRPILDRYLGDSRFVLVLAERPGS